LSERCRPWLYGLCLRVVHDRGVVDDLVQETLVRAFRDLPQLRDPGLFRAWLSRVALNVCRMHLRHSLPEREQELASLGALADPKRIGQSLWIGEALARLGADDRRLLVRFYLEGLSQAELADWLSLSASAVKSRLHRSRERLRRHSDSRAYIPEAGEALLSFSISVPKEALARPRCRRSLR
jgi:RNA polymerase sigma-70 factor (ECF subfamily)